MPLIHSVTLPASAVTVTASNILLVPGAPYPAVAGLRNAADNADVFFRELLITGSAVALRFETQASGGGNTDVLAEHEHGGARPLFFIIRQGAHSFSFRIGSDTFSPYNWTLSANERARLARVIGSFGAVETVLEFHDADPLIPTGVDWQLLSPALGIAPLSGESAFRSGSQTLLTGENTPLPILSDSTNADKTIEVVWSLTSQPSGLRLGITMSSDNGNQPELFSDDIERNANLDLLLADEKRNTDSARVGAENAQDEDYLVSLPASWNTLVRSGAGEIRFRLSYPSPPPPMAAGPWGAWAGRKLTGAALGGRKLSGGAFAGRKFTIGA